MRVWLVTVGEPLPTDGEHERLLRTGIVAGMLADRGHEVVWWTSAFDHFRKKLRADSDRTIAHRAGLRIRMLHGGGYRKNISFDRIRDHRRLAERFSALAPSEPRPDVIVVAFPPIELALAAVEYGRSRGIPTVLDVRDLWPDVMFDRAPVLLRPLARILLRGLTEKTRRASRSATHIWGHAPAFVEWGLAHAGRRATEHDRPYYFGYVDTPPDPAAIRQAEAFWDERGVRGDTQDLVACFTGTLGHQIDMETVIDAAHRLRDRADIRFVLCGDGDRAAAFRERASGLTNVTFPGWRDRAEIWVLLQRASVGIAPYVDRADFVATIPNKAAEYLSGGLPIAWSLDHGLLHDVLVQTSAGFTYGGNGRLLAEHLAGLSSRRNELERMSAAARRLFEQRFRAVAVYGEMIDHLERLAGAPRR